MAVKQAERRRSQAAARTSDLEVARRGGIAVLTLARPDRRNSLSESMLGALQQGGAELAFEIPTITREMVVVIQGLIILFSGALVNMPRPWLQWLLSLFSSPRKRGEGVKPWKTFSPWCS